MSKWLEILFWLKSKKLIKKKTCKEEKKARKKIEKKAQPDAFIALKILGEEEKN